MEQRIPKYDIDFRQATQDHFFLHVNDGTVARPSTINGPHSHNYYCISFLYTGKMPHFADLGDTEIHAPAVLVLNVDQVHIHAELEEGCKVITMSFSSEFIYRQNRRVAGYIEAVFALPFFELSAYELQDLDRYIHLICLEDQKGKKKNIEIIKCLLNVVLIQCAERCEKLKKNGHNQNDLCTNFRRSLNKFYRNHHQVTFYADRLNVTTSVLNETVKKTCHKTPKQMIDERLFTEAKRLLYWSDITVREVAWELGFETDGYFIRFFKKHAGTTPKDFQKMTQLE